MKKLAILGWTFLWISTVTLGGGMAMIPLMDREFVERRKWLTANDMLDVVSLVQSLPGLIAINMATVIGFRISGIIGAIVATLGSVITPFLVIAIIAHWATGLTVAPQLEHIFLGIRAGTAALVMMSLGKFAKSSLTNWWLWALAIIGFVAVVILQIDVTYVVFFGVFVGMCFVINRVIRSRVK